MKIDWENKDIWIIIALVAIVLALIGFSAFWNTPEWCRSLGPDGFENARDGYY